MSFRELLHSQVDNVLHSVTFGWVFAGTTLAAGTAVAFDMLSSLFGLAATGFGAVLTLVLIWSHVRKRREEAKIAKLTIKKLEMEINKKE